ncbi:MAG: hypothetical protein WC494_00680 [Candidatus Pacearchaeota archaeon]
MENKSWLVVFLLLGLLSVFTIRYVGYAVQTPSRVSIPGVCGNGVCEWNENCTSCQEDCGECPAPPAPDIPEGGGPSGGISVGPPLSISNFELDKNFLYYSIKQGETANGSIKVKNTGNNSQSITLSHNLEKFLFLSEEKFSLSPQEIKNIGVTVFAEDKEIPEVYTGKINVKSGNLTKYINVLINIKERSPLFDVSGELTEDYVYSGQKVEVSFNLTNMGHLKGIDVFFYYAIKDFDGNILTFKEESIAIEDKLELVRGLSIPRDLPPGQYVLYLKASYGENIATGSYSFFVLEGSEKKFRGAIVTLTSLIVLDIIIIYFLVRSKKEAKKNKRKNSL